MTQVILLLSLVIGAPSAPPAQRAKATKPARVEPARPAPEAVAPPSAPAVAPVPAPPRKGRLLVFDFSVQGEATRDLSRPLSDVAVREAVRVDAFKVLSQADVLTQLSLERQKQMLGCSADRSCLAEIAGAIDADRTLSGVVTKLGEGYFISASFFDVRKMTNVGNADETLRNPRPEELLDAVRRVVHRAMTGKELDSGGVLEFEVVDVGATILVDGEEIGRGPYRATRHVTEGAHRIHVAKPGYATWETSLRIEPGGRARVAPTLVYMPSAAPIGKRALGWSALGTGVAAVALGGVAVWKQVDSNRRYSDARAMLAPGGGLPVTASAQQYQDHVSAGRSAHQTAVVAGIGAGVALGATAVLGYLSYRYTGEIGPFRF